MDTIASCAFGVDSQAFTNKGRAHDMFSRIFRIWIYEIVPRNIICFDFISAQNWVKKVSFWPIINFFFQLRIIVKKVCRFVFKKFVKKCHELVKRFKICGICSEYFQAICQRWSKVGFSHASIWLGVKLLEISRFDYCLVHLIIEVF